MQSMEILQRLEGVDEFGEAKALCSVSIQREVHEQEPEAINSAFTKDAVVSFFLTLISNTKCVSLDCQFNSEGL